MMYNVKSIMYNIKKYSDLFLVQYYISNIKSLSIVQIKR